MLIYIITDIKYKDQLSNKLTSVINESNIIKLRNIWNVVSNKSFVQLSN